MRTRWFGYGFGVLLLVFVSQSVFAQQAPQQVASAGQLSKQAYQLAQSANSLNELTESLRICGRAMKATPTAEQKTYIQKLAGWIYNKRGEALVKLADQTLETDATRSSEYEAAAAKDFDLSIRFDKKTWKPRFNRAVSKAMMGEYNVALQDLDIVIQQQPSHKNARFNRAEILLQLGEYKRAITDYGDVLKLDPNDGAAYAGRGIAFAAIGRAEDAMSDLNAVVRLTPENAAAYVDRADLYAALGDWERAAGDYRIAISKDDQMSRAYQNVAWLMATCPEKEFRNPKLAVLAAKKALELQGPTYLGLDTYAAALASVGDFAKAAQAQQRAITSAPTDEQTNLQNRLALYRQQRPYVERPASQGDVRLATVEEEVPQ